MNKNFDNYNKPTTAGLVLGCSDKIIYDCIKFLEEKNNNILLVKLKKLLKLFIIKNLVIFFLLRRFIEKKSDLHLHLVNLLLI